MLPPLGTGGASSRAIAEEMHKWRNKDMSGLLSGADLAEFEDEDDQSSTAAEKQLKVQLKGAAAEVKEMSKRLSKESSDREKAVTEKKDLKDQVKELKRLLEDEKAKNNKRTGISLDGDQMDPTSLSGKKKMLQMKAKALMSPASKKGGSSDADGIE